MTGFQILLTWFILFVLFKVCGWSFKPVEKKTSEEPKRKPVATPTVKRSIDLKAGDDVRKGYSQHTHHSETSQKQKVRRMVQKAKDQELMETVNKGNQEWAKKQNEVAKKMKHAAKLNAHAAMVQSMGGCGSYGQAAYMNQAAALEMQDAAELMMDAADSHDPFI